MAKKKRGGDDQRSHRFGGGWTTAKLNVLAGYLTAYTTALRDKPRPDRPFTKAYIDAFAGTGYREPAQQDVGPKGFGIMETEPQELLDGSARIALKTDPRFDRYIFIEWSAKRCEQLEKLKLDFPALADNIRVQQGEANEVIQDLCKKDWSSRRAVLFLDPYGMQVEWKTIEAVASTKAIDLWLLFPLGIGVNRLLTKSGNIPVSWRDRLTTLLGTESWFEEFYKVRAATTLFGDVQESLVKARMETIGRFFNERLKTIFAGVADKPGVLRNSSNSPLYLFCFAAANERGAPIALKIANHLLKELR